MSKVVANNKTRYRKLKRENKNLTEAIIQNKRVNFEKSITSFL